MRGKGLRKFFLSIVFPSILAITLFVLSIFIVIIPSFERNIMDDKKEMISELTNTVWSLLEEYDQEHKNQRLSREEAQRIAASRVREIRYGREHKDYFWIIDRHPTMVMHPYTSELIHSDLTNYKDPNGKRLFVEAAELVALKGEGFIEYMWQWKDDSTRIVPKLSYVRGFESWGWIIGTGIYLEDVKMEIDILKKKLLRVSLFISLIITTILSFVVRQSLGIENKRKLAESRLLLSKQKYKSLVEASTEGTLMILDQAIIFSNAKFNEAIGYDATEVLSLSVENIFKVDWDQVVSSFDDSKKSISLETKVICHDNSEKEVILSVSEIKYDDSKGYIIIIKEVTPRERIEKETEHLTQELQTALLLMNQPIAPFSKDILKCTLDTPIDIAASLMTRKRRNVLFVQQDNEIIGVINDSDLKKRVLAEKLDSKRPVRDIMTSPVMSISENALVYEAILLLNNKKISHLGVRDKDGKVKGVISHHDIAGLRQNSVSFLIKEIEVAEDVDQLQRIQKRVPVLVNALIESSDKTQNITRIITSISDAITCRILSLAIEDLGNPPCDFAFMAMGSEGRMEQTLSTDQDNAIVFENVKSEELNETYIYFRKLGKRVNGNLNTVGFKYCDGEIMAENPKWTQPLAKWKEYFSEWIGTSDPQSILDASIFFDFRCVYGCNDLIDELRSHVNRAVDNKSVFFYHLAQTVIRYKPPISVFGKIVDKNHSGNQVKVDVKKILLPITGFVRLYALNNRLSETNTLSRIKLLYFLKIINKSTHDELVLSYNYLMHIRFRFQIKRILQNKTPDNIVDIKKLTQIEVTTIKKIFDEISNLQSKLSFDFKGTM